MIFDDLDYGVWVCVSVIVLVLSVMELSCVLLLIDVLYGNVMVIVMMIVLVVVFDVIL